MPQPNVGQSVHYVSHGSPVRPDGSQQYLPACRAAIVTGHPPQDALQDGEWPVVSLCVLNPTGMFFQEHSAHCDGDVMSGGTWHWAEAT
jgi:hypothetical protein